MHTIVVDDELLSMEQFEEECRGIPEINVVGKFDNPHHALEFARNNRVDFALLDVEMPAMNGLELGQELKKINPHMILIYVTGHTRYVVDVMKIKADYCIMKPYDEKDIKDAIERAKLLSKRQEKRIRVKMFGRFDVFVDDKVLHFQNKKSKELLALCLDHKGGNVTMEEATDKLWPDKPYDEKVKRLYRKAVGSVQEVLEAAGVSGIFKNARGNCHVSIADVQCDYYDYLNDPEGNSELFNEEYLFDYEWGEETLAQLMRDIY